MYVCMYVCMYFFPKGVFSGERTWRIGRELQAASCRWGGGRSSCSQFSKEVNFVVLLLGAF